MYIHRFGRNHVQYPVIELLQRVVQLITSKKESDAINFEFSNQIHTHFIIEKGISVCVKTLPYVIELGQV